MSLQIGQVQETPGAPQRATFPLMSFCSINQNIGGASSAFILQAVGGLTAVGTEMIIGATNVISGHIFAAAAGGGALVISLSMDGVATWDEYRRILLPGNNVTFFGPFRIGGYNARFKLYNDDAAAATFTGLIFMKAGA